MWTIVQPLLSQCYKSLNQTKGRLYGTAGASAFLYNTKKVSSASFQGEPWIYLSLLVAVEI